MLFAPYERYQYARAPLVEVICQLRFPTILSIGAKEPAEFQEAIRKDFPQYAARQEQLPPKVVQEGERHRAGASEAHYQLQLHLGGRRLEAPT